MKFVKTGILLIAPLVALCFAAQSFADAELTTPVFLGFVSQYEQVSKDEGQVLVGSVVAHSPAQSSGLKTGDVITTIDGEPFSFDNQLHWIRSTMGFRPGKPVTFGVSRKEESLDIRIVPVAADETQKILVGRYIEQLENCYHRGDCSACSVPGSSSESAVKIVGRYELDMKILESGGSAVLTIERTDRGLKFRSNDVEVPAGFSLEGDHHLKAHAERLAPGDSLRVKIVVKNDGRLQSSTELLDPAGSRSE